MTSKIGDLRSEGAGGEVFRENDAYYHVTTGMTMNEDDEEVTFSSKSDPFATLEALLATIPKGVEFIPA